MQVLAVSTFEGGFQPMSLATTVARMERAGVEVRVLDTYVDGVSDEILSSADLVAISVPLFDSIAPSIEIARRVRARRPDAHITFFGQYATINAAGLAGTYGDSGVLGEWEEPLATLAVAMQQKRGSDMAWEIPGIFWSRRPALTKPHFPRRNREALPLTMPVKLADAARVPFLVPNRDRLPPLVKYPQPHVERLTGRSHIVGGTEITRGCHHRCSYCSVFAAYEGRVFPIPEDIIVEDVRTLVSQGMTHLTFMDADFINAKHHGIKVLRRLHAEFPELTYDFTTRADHILENREAMTEMRGLGVRFVTSALEFPVQRVLDALDKKLTVAEIEECIAFMRETGIGLNPTFIMFNPWIGMDDLAMFHDFVARNRLEDVIEPIQYETRLNLYKGSPLLKDPFVRSLALTEHEFHVDWAHPDPQVDEVYRQNVTPREEGVFKRCCLKC